MIELLNQYKSTLLFIGKFLLIYLIGSWIYGLYLDGYLTVLDPFSISVTKQSAFILRQFESGIMTRYYEGIPRAFVYCNNNSIYNIIEGCNAVSVMLLFLAFLLAFNTKWQHYLWFAPMGLLIIHVSNIFRIAFIGVIAVEYPDFFQPAHDYLFPAWIYGTIVILWIIWVKMASKKS